MPRAVYPPATGPLQRYVPFAKHPQPLFLLCGNRLDVIARVLGKFDLHAESAEDFLFPLVLLGADQVDVIEQRAVLDGRHELRDLEVRRAEPFDR